MQSPLPRRLGCSGPSPKNRLLLLTIVAVLAACSEDDPAQPIGAAGRRNIPDASVRDLPGDGLESTPESDTNGRQPIGARPGNIMDAVDSRNGVPGRDASTLPDADAAADAGDASTADGSP